MSKPLNTTVHNDKKRLFDCNIISIAYYGNWTGDRMYLVNSWQNGTFVVCTTLAARPPAKCSTLHRLWCCAAGEIYVQPWNLYWQQHFHVDSHLENHVELCFRSPTTSKHSEVHQPACAAVMGYVIDIDTTTLWQCGPVWCSWPATKLAPVHSQHSWHLACHAWSMTMSLICSETCTGCRFWREHTFDWPCLSTSPVISTGPTRQKRYNVYILALANDW